MNGIRKAANTIALGLAGAAMVAAVAGCEEFTGVAVTLLAVEPVGTFSSDARVLERVEAVIAVLDMKRS